MRDKLHFTRSRQKFVVYSFLILWVVGINLWIFNYYYANRSTGGTKSPTSIYNVYDPSYVENEKPEVDQTKKPGKESDDPHQHERPEESILDHLSIALFHKQSGIKDTRYKDAHSTVYDTIFKNHDVDSILAHLNFNERCELYFRNLFAIDPNWWINPNEDLPMEDRDEFRFEKWRKKHLDRLKKEYIEENKKEIEPQDLKVDQEVENFIKKKYKEFWEKTMKVEQKIVDFLSHMRIFNRCYISNDEKDVIDRVTKFTSNQNKFVKQLFKAGKEGNREVPEFKPSKQETLLQANSFSSCSNLEQRVYPWLSLHYPAFERWTGDVYYTPPDMSKYISVPKSSNLKKKPVIKSQFTNNKACFLNEFKNAANSKGLVLSISNGHAEDTVHFIHLLRALNNKYPIQIVFYDELTTETKKKIVSAAREQLSALPKSFEKVAQYFPDDYLDEANGGLPRQEVWFVNVKRVVHDSYKGKFHKFSNKFLATMFNSFEEFILVDADTVFVQSPEFFFNLEGYKEKGAYFYRDRTAPQFRPEGDSVFFQKTSPSIIDSVMFDIPIMTDHTIKLPFFDGMSHFMESGVVVIDRNRHFGSILLMMQMNFMKPVMHRLYGDKEVFWLAFAANGDEDYVFNSYPAAAIGQLTDDKFRLNSAGKKKKSKELCSPHPGHINGEDGKSLAWFNSGYHFCGQQHRVDYNSEFEQGTRLKFLKSQKEMEAFYRDPLKITHAIIPPFKNKLETLCENEEEEPKEGWHMDTKYCKSYLWCAYSQIGGRTKDNSDNTQTGYIFQFDEKAQALFEYYGDIWVGME
ncbi:mannosyltransferase [Scheffersomyces xylosifermentans]|uniref:mannosyltransferase n=1 Tax=Scheffersomyces xylosifermentans TaxID=1304137 RepID=UPI00315D716C